MNTTPKHPNRHSLLDETELPLPTDFSWTETRYKRHDFRAVIACLDKKTAETYLNLPETAEEIIKHDLMQKWLWLERRHISPPYPPDWPHWCMHRNGGIIPTSIRSIKRSLLAWLWWEHRAEKQNSIRPTPRWIIMSRNLHTQTPKA